jgi:cation:H+ antiporter
MDAALLVNLGFLVAALALLVVGADRFVGATEELGLVLGVPHFIMGITVLAIGTSLPELVTAVVAVQAGTSEIVIGTVLGSNIANILLILGVTAIFARSFTITWDLMHGDLPMLFGSLLLLGFVVFPLSAADLTLYHQVTEAAAAGGDSSLGARSAITWVESLLLVIGYVLYLQYYAVRRNDQAIKDTAELAPDGTRFRPITLFWLAVGLLGVLVGANYTVEFSIRLAGSLGIANEIVAASIIALGTSIPELVVSISAARRNNLELVLGNVTGSNIFNTFVVLGVPGLLAPFLGDGQPLRVGEASVLFVQMPFYVATMVLFLVVVLDKTLTRTEGWVIFLAYVLFICKLFSWI